MTTTTRPPTLLWLIGLDHESGMRHGGNLRWFNLSRELLARGCRVYFGISRGPESDLAARSSYLGHLQRDGFISGHFVFDYHCPRWRLRAAGILGSHPLVLNRLLRGPQGCATRAISEASVEHDVDAIIVSDRSFLFLTESLRHRCPVFVDWVDSFVLYHRRELRLALRAGWPRSALSLSRSLIAYYLQERYYGARAAANFLASPVDKHCLDATSRSPERNHTLLNGLSVVLPSAQPERIETRLIFTGNMNFPPNHEAAMWFIDQVLPLIHQHRPEVTLVVAGRNPLPALVAKSGPAVRILGDVADMLAEISASSLYVAPLVSGGGFKNKVIEAIACGVFVVSTRRGVEFLDDTVQAELLVADSAVAFAEQVLRFLNEPQRFRARLRGLQARVISEFTWEGRAGELLTHINRTCEGLSSQGDLGIAGR